MKNKRQLRNRHRKSDMQEAFVLCLNQRRHDVDGNRIPGYDVEEIMAMTPAERERVRQAGWLATRNQGGMCD
jgi:hypothetical protein